MSAKPTYLQLLTTTVVSCVDSRWSYSRNVPEWLEKLAHKHQLRKADAVAVGYVAIICFLFPLKKRTRETKEKERK